MVVCLKQGADLHMAQLMPLPLTVSCFRKVQIGFTFLVPAHLGSPGQTTVKRACVCKGGACRPDVVLGVVKVEETEADVLQLGAQIVRALSLARQQLLFVGEDAANLVQLVVDLTTTFARLVQLILNQTASCHVRCDQCQCQSNISNVARIAELLRSPRRRSRVTEL